MKLLPNIIVIFAVFSLQILAQSGRITGVLTDAKTMEPLIGVNIIVNELINTGATTDTSGSFAVRVPNGLYSITASLVGYQTVVKTDLVVTSASNPAIFIRLTETTVEMQQTVITADYFDRSVQENNISTVILAPEEIKRSPGSNQDFMRILQTMPGVSFSSDQTNELIVRGGSPNENLTILDGMEIPSTNHYPNEFNSGGPINMVNVDLIEEIKFSTGGFISKYGDKLSSVMQITTREGSRDRGLAGNTSISFAGAGVVLEGGLGNGRGAWIVSVRKSYLDLISGAIGLTAVPQYYDGQFKLTYDLNKSNKISISGIYGHDNIFFEGDTDFKDEKRAGVVDSLGLRDIDVFHEQYAVGLTLSSLWSKSVYSTATFYYSSYKTNLDVKELFSRRIFDSKGDASYFTINERPVFTQNSLNQFGGLRAELVWNVQKNYEFSAGTFIGTGDYTNTSYINGDSVRYWTGSSWVEVQQPATVNKTDVQFFSQYKTYQYINNKISLFDERLELNVGLRYDYFSYSDQGNISPRASLTYGLIPLLTHLNFSYGEYYQTQNYPTYGDRYNLNINKNLKNTHARHFVLGVDHILGPGLRVSLEGYYKSYSDIPIDETYINFYDRTFRSEKRINVGKTKSYGLDFLIQQKLVNDLYGTFSLSHSSTKFEDVRIGHEGEKISDDYDYPWVITAVLGKRFVGFRDKLDETPFYLKYLTYLVPFSNDMELSFKWRYASGRPYTAQVWTTEEQAYEGEVRWAAGSWKDADAVNASRYPDYHRLDLAIYSRFNFDKWNMILFFEMQNIYNRKNIASYSYNSDGTIDNIYQYSLLPVLGLEIEF